MVRDIYVIGPNDDLLDHWIQNNSSTITVSWFRMYILKLRYILVIRYICVNLILKRHRQLHSNC